MNIEKVFQTEIDILKCLLEIVKDSKLTNEQYVLDFVDELNKLSVSI